MPIVTSYAGNITSKINESSHELYLADIKLIFHTKNKNKDSKHYSKAIQANFGRCFLIICIIQFILYTIMPLCNPILTPDETARSLNYFKHCFFIYLRADGLI